MWRSFLRLLIYVYDLSCASHSDAIFLNNNATTVGGTLCGLATAAPSKAPTSGSSSPTAVCILRRGSGRSLCGRCGGLSRQRGGHGWRAGGLKWQSNVRRPEHDPFWKHCKLHHGRGGIYLDSAIVSIGNNASVQNNEATSTNAASGGGAFRLTSGGQLILGR